MNKQFILGTLGNKEYFDYGKTDKGTSFFKFSIKANKNIWDGYSFWTCKAWGDKADQLKQLVDEGSIIAILVEGESTQYKYKETNYFTLNVDNFEVVTGEDTQKKAPAPKKEKKATQKTETKKADTSFLDDNTDDLPFG